MNVSVREQGTTLAIQGLGDLGAAAMQAAGKGLARGLQLAISRAQRAYLTGPRPGRLGVVTGRLRGSLSHQVDVGTDRVVGRVGTNVPYGAYHEFGFRGVVSVREHTRTHSVTTRGGKAVDISGRRGAVIDKGGRLVGYRRGYGATAAKLDNVVLGTGKVKAHQRRVEYAGRPFLRPALRDTSPQIVAAIQSELRKMDPKKPS